MAGFFDVFKAVKSQEDAAALQILPGLIAEVDAITDASARLGHALRGVFAGNIFDLGASTADVQIKMVMVIDLLDFKI